MKTLRRRGCRVKINFMMLKKIGAVLLLVSFFLPLSRCETTGSYPVNEEGYSEEIPEELKEYDYFYAWEGMRDGEPLAIVLIPLAFLWPIIFLAARGRFKKPKINKGLLFLEPVVAGAGSYFVFMINFLNDLYIGFFVAMVAALLFFLGSVAEIVEFFKKRTV